MEDFEMAHHAIVFHCLVCCLFRQQVHQHSTPLAVDSVITHSERIDGQSVLNLILKKIVYLFIFIE